MKVFTIRVFTMLMIVGGFSAGADPAAAANEKQQSKGNNPPDSCAVLKREHSKLQDMLRNANSCVSAAERGERRKGRLVTMGDCKYKPEELEPKLDAISQQYDRCTRRKDNPCADLEFECEDTEAQLKKVAGCVRLAESGAQKPDSTPITLGDCTPPLETVKAHVADVCPRSRRCRDEKKYADACGAGIASMPSGSTCRYEGEPGKWSCAATITRIQGDPRGIAYAPSGTFSPTNPRSVDDMAALAAAIEPTVSPKACPRFIIDGVAIQDPVPETLQRGYASRPAHPAVRKCTPLAVLAVAAKDSLTRWLDQDNTEELYRQFPPPGCEKDPKSCFIKERQCRGGIVGQLSLELGACLCGLQEELSVATDINAACPVQPDMSDESLDQRVRAGNPFSVQFSTGWVAFGSEKPRVTQCVLLTSAIAAGLAPEPLPSEAITKLHQDGLELMNRGDIRGSIAVFTRCINADPKSAICHHALGVAYSKVGDEPNSYGHYKSYLTLLPDADDADHVRALTFDYERKHDY